MDATSHRWRESPQLCGSLMHRCLAELSHCGGSPKLGHPPPLWVTFQQTTPQDRPAGNSANVFMHCGSGFLRKFRSIRTREAVHRYAPVRAAGTQRTSVRVTRTPCCCNGPATVVERLARIFHRCPSKPCRTPCKAAITARHTQREPYRALPGVLWSHPDTLPPPRLGLRAVFVSSRRPGAAVWFRASAAGSWRVRMSARWASARPGTGECAACCA